MSGVNSRVGCVHIKAIVQICYDAACVTRIAVMESLASQASGNVAGLCNWAAAMCSYHAVETEVQPKIVALRGAEAELYVAERDKAAALQQLAVVQSELDSMQAQFEAAMQTKTTLEADAAATQKRMDNANALLGALAGEETRWTQQSQAFDATIQRLTGACLLMPLFFA